MITVTDSAALKVKELLEAEGQPELALRVAEKSVKSHPSDPGPFERVAQHYERSGDLQLAVKHYRRAYQVNPLPRIANALESVLRRYTLDSPPPGNP